ncbi:MULTISPECIES: TenA family transcriptional regulator [Sorangium]|uniref:Iron-containing redox enzyme family protein n=1 Tax=Sorangium atrum TaxID=2995308 RepID=A0ABT5BTR1_9BACT|nr:iron-containing redox enzyme family protein [Sorangium aterium]MDC0676960.1 iron-containing redox enzyme family protein [Sorangium aterium]
MLSPRSQRHKEVKDSLKATPHPVWIDDMLESLADQWKAAVYTPPIARTLTEPIDHETWSVLLREFFCVVEAFPKYMGLSLAKTTYGQSPRDFLVRDWLIGNIRVEALHVRWYLDWAAGHGISTAEITSHRPSPEVASLFDWLWSISYRGSLAEAVGAVNYAIEGITGEWSRVVLPAFTKLYGEGSKSLTWLAAHANYDDAHPREALEIVKLATTSGEEMRRVQSSISRSLELFERAFKAVSVPSRGGS